MSNRFRELRATIDCMDSNIRASRQEGVNGSYSYRQYANEFSGVKAEIEAATDLSEDERDSLKLYMGHVASTV